jgi:hypothetical protein
MQMHKSKTQTPPHQKAQNVQRHQHLMQPLQPTAAKSPQLPIAAPQHMQLQTASRKPAATFAAHSLWLRQPHVATSTVAAIVMAAAGSRRPHTTFPKLFAARADQFIQPNA